MREHTELYQDYLGWGLQDKADSFSHFHGSIGRYPIFVVKLQGLKPYKTEVFLLRDLASDYVPIAGILAYMRGYPVTPLVHAG